MFMLAQTHHKKHSLDKISCRFNSTFFIQNFRILLLGLFILLGTNAQSQTIEVLSITPSKTTVLTGEDYTYSIQYRCAGITGNCNGQKLCLTVPTEIAHGVLLFGDAAVSNSSYDAGTREACWTMGVLSTGRTGEVTLSLRFRENFTPNNTTATLTAGGINSPVVTAITDPKLVAEKNGASSVGLDGSVTYNLSIKNTTVNGSSRGGIFQDNVTFTDTWPTGATLVGYTQNTSLPAPTITANSITFNVGTMSSGDGTGFSVTIKYPAGTFPENTTFENKAQGKGTPRGGSEISSNEAKVTTQVQAARCDVRINFRGDQTGTNVTAGANLYSRFGWGNYASIDVSNASNVPASIDAVHDIPLAFTPIKFVLYNNSASGGINFYYKTNLNNSSWTLWSGSPYSAAFNGTQFDVTTLNLGATEYITQIRVRDTSTIPAGGGISMAYHYDFTGTDRNGASVTGPITMRLRYKTTCTGGLGPDPVYDPDQLLEIRVVPPYTEVALEKYVSPGAVPPGGIVTYTARWDLNETFSSSAPRNPIVTDLLPVGMEYVAGSAKDFVGSPLPATEEVIPNFANTGRTLVRWKFTGIYGANANNGRELVVFQAKARAGTAVSVQENVFNVSSDDQATSSKFRWPNSGKDIVDVLDLDGDGSTTDIIVSSEKALLNVIELASLESYKWVKGSLDAAESRYPNTGRTTPGGTADYRLIVRNLGNITMKNITVVDILPFVGDKAVIGMQARLTEWRPSLISAVSFSPNNPNIKVYYSTSQNPCRAEVYNSAGCVNDWSLTPPANLSTVQSLKFDFGTLTLAGGDSIQLSWQMRAPIDAPTAGEIAWNSFAYATTRADNNVVLAPSEPVKVGISVNPNPKGSLGNFVWIDTNGDGLQAGETGLNNVTVNLLNGTGGLITSTLTMDFNGQPGYYLFPNLDAGDYFVQFIAPATYTLTGQNKNTATGSDADPATGKTDKIILGTSENNLDIDAGLKLIPTCTTPTAVAIVVAPNSGITTGSTINFTANATGTTASSTYIWAGPSGTPPGSFSANTQSPSATAPATAGNYTYSVTISNGTGCSASATASVSVSPACVPPTTTASITPPTCAGATAQSNGLLRLSGFTNEEYQYVTGSTFTGTPTPTSPTAILSNSVLIDNLSNTAKTFTIRIYNATDSSCFIDRVITQTPIICTCPPPKCVPIGISVNN